MNRSIFVLFVFAAIWFVPAEFAQNQEGEEDNKSVTKLLIILLNFLKLNLIINLDEVEDMVVVALVQLVRLDFLNNSLII